MLMHYTRYHRPLIALAALLLVGGIIAAYALSSKTSYDFPLVRDTNSIGSMAVNDFVEVVERPDVSSEPSSVPAPAPDTSALAPTTASKDGITAAMEEKGELPPRIRIEVPFSVQAPFGNWEMPYQEACEETSVIMVHHFLEGTPLTPEIADREILNIIEWENKEFNYSADVTAEELKQIAEDYYHHTGQLFYDFTIEDMKRLLAHGYPIIVPLSGRDLGNPYYSGEGPWYHMLVVTGYDGNRFITNDVGTKRGKDYMYNENVLYDAIHNWNQQKENIREGRKVILVLEK